MGHGGNVFEELMADHREVEEIFARIQEMAGGGQELRDLVNEVTIELVRHSVAEEEYLYPAGRQPIEGATASRTRRSRTIAGSRSSSSNWRRRTPTIPR
jgi:hemerythrin superfamily protein